MAMATALATALAMTMAVRSYSELHKDWREFSGVYVIENRKSGDIYIGHSSNCFFRWWSHLEELRNGSHANKHLQAAFDKDGVSSFNFRIESFAKAKSRRLRLESDLIQAMRIRGRFVYNINHAN